MSGRKRGDQFDPRRMWERAEKALPALKRELKKRLSDNWQLNDGVLTLEKPIKPSGYSDATLGLQLTKLNGDDPEVIFNVDTTIRQWKVVSGGKYILKATIRSNHMPSYSAEVEIYIRL